MREGSALDGVAEVALLVPPAEPDLHLVDLPHLAGDDALAEPLELGVLGLLDALEPVLHRRKVVLDHHLQEGNLEPPA